MIDLVELLPVTKHDTEKAAALIALGFPRVQPVLPQLLTWIKDLNWPVAQVLQPFLFGIGAPLAPYLRDILATDDFMWKYWILQSFILESRDLALLLRHDVERVLAETSPDSELNEFSRLISRKYYST